MNMKLVEPLRELFKDEVRALGRELGLPPDLVNRHPFPGPGLAIRIPGDITREKLDLLRQVRRPSISTRSARPASTTRSGRPRRFTAGAHRRREWATAAPTTRACALRAVTSTDGMTADYYPFDHAFLGRVAARIINEVRGSTG